MLYTCIFMNMATHCHLARIKRFSIPNIYTSNNPKAKRKMWYLTYFNYNFKWRMAISNSTCINFHVILWYYRGLCKSTQNPFHANVTIVRVPIGTKVETYCLLLYILIYFVFCSLLLSRPPWEDASSGRYYWAGPLLCSLFLIYLFFRVNSSFRPFSLFKYSGKM